MDKKWYVLRTYSGHENKVKAYIENEIAQAGLSDKVGSVIVPSEKVFEVKDGKKKSKTRTFFPGYILVEADPRQDHHAHDSEHPVGDQLRRPEERARAAAGLARSAG